MAIGLNAKLLLEGLGATLFAAGLIICTVPVAAVLGTQCEEGGCAAYATFILPSVALGSLVIVAGLLALAFGLGMDRPSN
jgi:hypothetical protein